MKQSIKLILIIFILCLCGTYPVKADDDYTLQSVYNVSLSSSPSNMPQITMPEVYMYPTVSSSSVENTLVLTNTTRYLLTEQIRYEESLHNTYLTPTRIQGDHAGYITAYTQRIIYTNTKSDMYGAHLNIIESKGGSGTVTIYFQKNGDWIQGAVDHFENTYTSGDILPESDITGWRFDVAYTLNDKFKLFTTNDNLYANGYKMNSIGLNIDSPSDEEEETHGLLNTIKSAIDNVKNAIDDVITGITNLPSRIANGLKGFFDNIKDAIDDVITGITNLPGKIANGLKGFFDNIKDAIDDVITGITNLPSRIANGLKGFFDNIKDAIDDVITGITNLPRLILDGLKELFIPDDFSATLQDGLEDISDSLGVVGYPIQFLNDTLNTIKNTSGESLTVHLPSFNYKGHVIFPSYYKPNIFYFGNNLVFSNVNLVTPFTQFFNLFGVDCSTVTVGQLVKILMRFCTGIALIGAILNYYNNIFGTNIDSGEGDGDDN